MGYGIARDECVVGMDGVWELEDGRKPGALNRPMEIRTGWAMRSPRSVPARRTVHSIDCVQRCVDFPVSSFILMSEMSLSCRRRKVAGAGLDGRARHRLAPLASSSPVPHICPRTSWV